MFLTYVWCSAHGCFIRVAISDMQRDWASLLHSLFFSSFLVVSGFFCFHVYGGFCYTPIDPTIYFLSNKMYNLPSSISRKLSIESIDKCGDCPMDIRFDSLVG